MFKPEYIASFKSLYEELTPGECWIWKGAFQKRFDFPKERLYGVFRPIQGAPRQTAHRVAYQIAHGPIPEGQSILHACDNPNCVNPHHLSVGSQRDNNLDRNAKGRNVIRTGRNPFSYYDASYIRVAFAYSHGPINRFCKAVALRFGHPTKTINVYGIVRPKASHTVPPLALKPEYCRMHELTLLPRGSCLASETDDI